MDRWRIFDTWTIGNIANFPGSTVNIFNRFGTRLFTSVNYGVLWDGRYKGADLPSGVYYYVIDTKAKPGILSGYVTIVR